MKVKWLALVLGASLALTACGGNDNDSADKEQAENTNETTTAGAGESAKLYENKCASCHAVNLEGGVGPDLTKVGSRLSKDEIEEIILKGQNGMPKGIIIGDEASRVAEWLSEHK